MSGRPAAIYVSVYYVSVRNNCYCLHCFRVLMLYYVAFLRSRQSITLDRHRSHVHMISLPYSLGDVTNISLRNADMIVY